MKILYSAGQAVAKGTYWDPETGQRTDFDSDGVLPGKNGKKYLRLPAGGMLPIAVLIGFLYVLCLPFIGIATLLSMFFVPIFGFASGVMVVSGKALGAFFGMIGRSICFGWSPSNAYLTGKRKKRVHGSGKRIKK